MGGSLQKLFPTPNLWSSSCGETDLAMWRYPVGWKGGLCKVPSLATIRKRSTAKCPFLPSVSNLLTPKQRSISSLISPPCSLGRFPGCCPGQAAYFSPSFSLIGAFSSARFWFHSLLAVFSGSSSLRHCHLSAVYSFFPSAGEQSSSVFPTVRGAGLRTLWMLHPADSSFLPA